jgi:putative magnesium chelatase accessory protein
MPGTWPDWRAGWPLADSARLVEAAGLRWHVHRLGRGPVALLLHGTGGSAHSMAPLAERLAARCTVVVPDLPGHAFTASPPDARLSLAGMAADVRALLDALGDEPVLAVGHSAGAGVLLRLALDDRLPQLRLLVGVAAAVVPPPPLLQQVLHPLLAPFARSTLVAELAAGLAARDGVVDRLLAGTGSAVPEASRALYRALARSPVHAHAALAMMAQWDLPTLLRDAPRLRVPALFVAGADDRWVPTAAVRAQLARIPQARVVALPGRGHLVHEEAPDDVAALVLEGARAVGVAV